MACVPGWRIVPALGTPSGHRMKRSSRRDAGIRPSGGRSVNQIA
jgi:hypothetical protein